jgi:hypothetical protein
MAQQRKYTLMLKAPNRPYEWMQTDDQTEVLNRLAEFRMQHADPRAELYTRGESGFEWWDKEDYYYQPFSKLDDMKLKEFRGAPHRKTQSFKKAIDNGSCHAPRFPVVRVRRNGPFRAHCLTEARAVS